jgi:hypothetical protein
MFNQLIKNRINQLEESYHFNLEEFSFEYKGKKAFINKLSDNLKLVWPFMHIRKQLASITDELEGNMIGGPKQTQKFAHLCMQIIGNMLDSDKMGSVESYMDHIWKDYKAAVESDDSQPMQNFLTMLADIVTMIDCCCELDLSSLDELDRDSLIGASMIETLHPEIEIVGAMQVTEDGSVVKMKTMKKESNDDLRRMRPLNTKEI